MNDEKMLHHMDEQFSKINQHFTEMDSKMDQRFSEVDKKFAEVDKKFANVDHKINELNSKVDTNFQYINKILNWLVGGIGISILVQFIIKYLL